MGAGVITALKWYVIGTIILVLMVRCH